MWTATTWQKILNITMYNIYVFRMKKNIINYLMHMQEAQLKSLMMATSTLCVCCNVFWCMFMYIEICIIVPQRQEPSSCCTSSSLVWQWWQRLRLRCLEPLRDEDDDDIAEKDDNGEDSSPSGTSLTLARFSGETSLSDSEVGDTNKLTYTGGKRQ